MAVCLTHRVVSIADKRAPTAGAMAIISVHQAHLGLVGVVGGYDGDECGLPDTPRFAAFGSSYREQRPQKKPAKAGFFIAADQSLSERNVCQTIQIPFGIQCSHATGAC